MKTTPLFPRPSETSNKWRGLLWCAVFTIPIALGILGHIVGLLLGGFVLGFRGGVDRLDRELP